MVPHYPPPDSHKASLYRLSSSPADSLAVPRMCQAQPSLRNFLLVGVCPQNVGWLTPFVPFSLMFSLCPACMLTSMNCFSQAPLSCGLQPGSTGKRQESGRRQGELICNLLLFLPVAGISPLPSGLREVMAPHYSWSPGAHQPCPLVLFIFV